MMDGIKVSVIVPVYNVELYIEACIKSILNQTFKDIEIILINDGSKDLSIQLADNILVSSGIKYKILKQQNMGVSAARNTGIHNAVGEYLCFIDADDIITPGHIENLYNAIAGQGYKFGFSEYEPTMTANRYGSEIQDNRQEIKDMEAVQKDFLNRRIRIHLSAIMIERQLLEDRNLFFHPKLRFGEDVEFLWRCLAIAERAVYIHAKTYKYLTRENSQMTRQYIDRIVLFTDIFKDTLQKLHFKGNLYWELVYARVVFGMLHSFAKFSDYKTFLDLLQKIPYKEICKEIKNVEDKRVSCMNTVLNSSPKLFWMISKKV